MVKRTGGSKRKSKDKLTKSLRTKGKIGLSRYFAVFKEGDKVALKAEPSVQKGQYYRRYHGKVGIVKGKRGRCYEVIVKHDTKIKTFMVHPVHLKKV